MTLDLEKLGFTKRSMILLVMLALLIIVFAVFYWQSSPEQPAAVKVQTPVGNLPPSASTDVNPAGGTLNTANQASLAVRDPFSVPVAYQHTDSANKSPGGSTTNYNPPNAGTSVAAPAVPQLLGTVVGSYGKTAILALGKESRSVRIGEFFSGYILVAVGNDYAVVRGPSGSLTLRVGR